VGSDTAGVLPGYLRGADRSAVQAAGRSDRLTLGRRSAGQGSRPQPGASLLQTRRYRVDPKSAKGTRAVVEANCRLYRKSSAKRNYELFPARSHFILGQAGWEEVADYAPDWARQNGVSASVPGADDSFASRTGVHP
jgi:hypothetical protein